MRYDDFVGRLADLSNQSEEAVREVLFYMPEVLTQLKEGENLRTPLGSFRVKQREARAAIVPPRGTVAFPVVGEMAVKLRSGTRLRRRQRLG